MFKVIIAKCKSFYVLYHTESFTTHVNVIPGKRRIELINLFLICTGFIPVTVILTQCTVQHLFLIFYK